MTHYISFNAASKARGLVGPYLRFMFGFSGTKLQTIPTFIGLTHAGRNFSEYYQAEIQPQLLPFEDVRQRKLRSLRIRSSITVIGGSALILLMVMLILHGQINNGIEFCLISLLVLVCWTAAPILSYRQDVKRDIFPRILAFFGADFRYFPEAQPAKTIVPTMSDNWKKHVDILGSSRSRNPSAEEVFQDFQNLAASRADWPLPVQLAEFAPSGIVPRHDKSDEEDILLGSHHGVRIALLESRQYIKGEKSDRLVFHGLFIRLSMNKSFHGRTMVRTDKGLFNWAQSKQGLSRVALEDPRFEKIFEVHGSDQTEARYLLTPSMMERLAELGRLFDQPRGIEAAFYDRHLLLKIPLRDNRWFEGGDLFTPVTFEEDVRVIFAQMNIIFAMIDLLRLHEQTRL